MSRTSESGGLPGDRSRALTRATRLELVTVAWNLVEGAIGMAGATASGSTALLGFSVDSFVESASGGIMLWRLRAERTMGDGEDLERIEHRARRLVALSLFALAVYVAFDAVTTLWERERPGPTLVGVVLPAVSLVLMGWLARAKRRVASALESRALVADAFQTSACFWLSLFVLAGIGLNRVFGWWWADPVAALGMTWFIAKEGREAWRGEDACRGGTND